LLATLMVTGAGQQTPKAYFLAWQSFIIGQYFKSCKQMQRTV